MPIRHLSGFWDYELQVLILPWQPLYLLSHLPSLSLALLYFIFHWFNALKNLFYQINPFIFYSKLNVMSLTFTIGLH